MGDYKEGTEDYVQYRAYLLKDEKIEFIFKEFPDGVDRLVAAAWASRGAGRSARRLPGDGPLGERGGLRGGGSRVTRVRNAPA